MGTETGTEPLTAEERMRERDARWEPKCQFIKADETTAKGYGDFGGGHPWPLTPMLADAYHLLCGVRRKDHPATFAGPHWNHAEFVYDPDLDTSEEADRRRLLTELAARSSTPLDDGGLDSAWREAEEALPQGWRLTLGRDESDWDTWVASAVSPAFFEGENDDDIVFARASSVVAACRALAETLRNRG
jgi:hypothetical protein